MRIIYCLFTNCFVIGVSWIFPTVAYYHHNEHPGSSLDRLTGSSVYSKDIAPDKFNSNEKSTFSGAVCHYGANEYEGICLPLRLCSNLLISSKNVIDYKKNVCLTKERTVGVCCPQSVLGPTQNAYRYENTMITKGKRKRSTAELEVPEHIKVEEETCGRNGQMLSEELLTRSWPWAVSIMVASTKEHHCGGSLISRSHVLSAAHCFVYKEGVATKNNILVRLGEYDFEKSDETNFEDHKLAALINHEDYDVTNFEHDISLLVLEKPAVYNIYIQPICMPKPEEEYTNRTSTVIGWGHVKRGGPGSKILREIEVPVWQYATCSSNIAQTIFTTNLCAGDNDGQKDSCQGDSGGPLMMQRNHRWELAGIVSWGVKCAEKNKPGVYTQVNKYLDWIYENINES